MSAAVRPGDDEPVLREARDGAVLRLVLNRPAARNALSINGLSLGRTHNRMSKNQRLNVKTARNIHHYLRDFRVATAGCDVHDSLIDCSNVT